MVMGEPGAWFHEWTAPIRNERDAKFNQMEPRAIVEFSDGTVCTVDMDDVEFGEWSGVDDE